MDTWDDVAGIENQTAAQRALLKTPELLPIVSVRDDWDYQYDKYIYNSSFFHSRSSICS